MQKYGTKSLVKNNAVKTVTTKVISILRKMFGAAKRKQLSREIYWWNNTNANESPAAARLALGEIVLVYGAIL